MCRKKKLKKETNTTTMKLQVSIDKPAWTICYHYDGTIVFVHKTINQSTEAICLYLNPN